MHVNSEFHGCGIGREMMKTMQSIYHGFHQQVLIAEYEAILFYKVLGFKRAGKTKPMTIYGRNKH